MPITTQKDRILQMGLKEKRFFGFEDIQINKKFPKNLCL
jgi:hypothetical protein